MALQIHPIFSLLIIFSLCNFSSCYGRNVHFFHNKIQEYNNHLSYFNNMFNVDDFGAKGDGSSDDTQAFKKAWKKACATSGAVLLVPSNKNYLLKPITFSGPCNTALTIEISGSILASADQSDYQKNTRRWLVFDGIDNLSVQGNGVIDGNGKIWWENSCKINKKKPCKHAPTALEFSRCKNLVVKELNIQNAQQMHVTFNSCNYVKASSLKVAAPGNSPNTDGIHITNTQNIDVTNTFIGTGDDCISIEDGSHSVRATNITCGPGHGISIGSLGDNNSEAHVSDIIVDGATLSNTTNGLRIKTWQGGSGVASNIIFRNIKLSNVDNPIIIDQNYCDQDEPCKKQESAVQVKDVVYENIAGTSSSEKAVIFNCSEKYPCEDITMENIKINSCEGDKIAEATCNNVQLNKMIDVSPQCSATYSRSLF
ncbi:polygalacturonase-like [Amaranthus tricolor]|uniref:polygalacturonase-like n=1 Tax=Amaranthus tricolor TaxID=29722 RepID=UPI002590B7CE|nr:polygalacturonase-like [Amaranthus tricolor]